MTRGLAALPVVLVAILPVAAQPPGEAVRLTVSPAAAPVPALRFRLLPEVREQAPGNALLVYQRAHSPEWWAAHQRQQSEFHKNYDEWLRMPLKDLPRDKVRSFLPQASLAEVERAARREHCDWELAPRLRKDGIGLLLPEVQTFREFATLLNLRARLEIAEGKYDQAVRTLETGFAMAQHVGEAPVLIHALVGMAIAAILDARVQELIQQPDAPNLYWALTGLPRPFIDLRKPLQGERLMVDSMFPGVREALADPKAAPPTAEQVRVMLGQLTEIVKDLRPAGGTEFLDGLAAAVMAAKSYPGAKRFLMARGWTAEQLEAMPMLAAVLMYEVYNYDRVFDDMLKWQGLPYWEARPGLQQAERQLCDARARGDTVGMMLAHLLLPAVAKVQEASARTDRRIAALRCVEAIRLYAAGHDGKLPASLSDIREVPVPLDPFTGKPFEYQASGDQATLTGPPPAGDKPAPHQTLRYELTLRRK